MLSPYSTFGRYNCRLVVIQQQGPETCMVRYFGAATPFEAPTAEIANWPNDPAPPKQDTPRNRQLAAVDKFHRDLKRTLGQE